MADLALAAARFFPGSICNFFLIGGAGRAARARRSRSSDRHLEIDEFTAEGRGSDP